ncbi:Two-component sensor histidine kinase [Minicystis rosea]|nr:Two-component sensor histidine kinase [Minicystis rosea]
MFGLAMTAALLHATMRLLRAEDSKRFDHEVAITESVIQQRIETYLTMLHGARGLFATAGVLRRESFHAYVQGLHLAARTPTPEAFGFIRRVTRDGVANEAIEGRPIWPAGDRGERFAVLYVEPSSAQNDGMIGFDVATQPALRAAVENARRTRLAEATGRAPFPGADGNAPSGFFLIEPIFQAPASGAEPRVLVGLVFAGFRGSEMFGHVFPDGHRRPIDFEVYDGLELGTAHLLYDDDDELRAALPLERRAFTALSRIDVCGRPWAISFATRPEFVFRSERGLAELVGASGAIVSLLLFAIVREQWRARERAEEAVRRGDEFLCIASHELSTPLTPLRLQLEAIRAVFREGRPLDRARLDAMTTVAHRQTLRLVRLTLDLLEATRLSRGRLELHRQHTDLLQVARDAVARFANEIARHGGEIRFDVAEPVSGDWDPQRLDHVVTNLLANALRYGLGRTIHVVVEQARDHVVRLSIEDHGIGIPLEAHERIFRRYERLASTLHDRGGLGLGLYVARHIVEAHGGTIRVQSSPGAGSTFVVELPQTARA